jgi:hypothetical protein
MSNRSWFFASEGKQQGPRPEAQLREFIANGTVTAETLVWTEGMAGWGMPWRTLLFALCCGLLIPTPWVLRWCTGWNLSQFELVERTAYANT